MSKNKTLQRLILNNNDLENFKKQGVESICKNLENHPNIQLIDFSSMTVTGCGDAVGKLLKSTQSLKTIILNIPFYLWDYVVKKIMILRIKSSVSFFLVADSPSSQFCRISMKIFKNNCRLLLKIKVEFEFGIKINFKLKQNGRSLNKHQRCCCYTIIIL